MSEFRKCQQCDMDKEKTVDLNENRYIKDSKGYYHYDCYIQKLINQKNNPYTLKEAEIETARLWNKIQKSDEQIKRNDNLFKDKLVDLLLEIYDLKISTEIPSHFYIQLNNITLGKHNKVSESISYCDLYYMYSKLKNKLNKIAYNKKISGKDRLFWDLSIVLSEYPSYKKWKLSKLEETEEIKKAIELHKISKQIKVDIAPNEKSFDINDEELIF